jgi:hypothetical protein
MDRQELQRLEAEAAAELAEARAAMPAHSIRPHQQQRLEEAEERLAEVRARLKALDAAD